MRSSKNKMHPILYKELNRMFVQLVRDIRTEEQAQGFVNDFFSEAEREIFTKRLAIFYWLKKGRSYSNIKQNIKISSATIASTQNQMNKPGVKKILSLLEAEEWSNLWNARIKKFINPHKIKYNKT